jgi:hypothetical protein
LYDLELNCCIPLASTAWGHNRGPGFRCYDCGSQPVTALWTNSSLARNSESEEMSRVADLPFMLAALKERKKEEGPWLTKPHLLPTNGRHS